MTRNTRGRMRCRSDVQYAARSQAREEEVQPPLLIYVSLSRCGGWGACRYAYTVAKTLVIPRAVHKTQERWLLVKSKDYNLLNEIRLSVCARVQDQEVTTHTCLHVMYGFTYRPAAVKYFLPRTTYNCVDNKSRPGFLLESCKVCRILTPWS